MCLDKVANALKDQEEKVLHRTHPGTVKICMQHPEHERSQVVLEMCVNEGLKE